MISNHVCCRARVRHPPSGRITKINQCPSSDRSALELDGEIVFARDISTLSRPDRAPGLGDGGTPTSRAISLTARTSRPAARTCVTRASTCRTNRSRSARAPRSSALAFLRSSAIRWASAFHLHGSIFFIYIQCLSYFLCFNEEKRPSNVPIQSKTREAPRERVSSAKRRPFGRDQGHGTEERQNPIKVDISAQKKRTLPSSRPSCQSPLRRGASPPASPPAPAHAPAPGSPAPP